VRASVGTAPVSQAVIVDVNKNGATIISTQSNRLTIAAGTVTDLADAINLPNVSAGEFLTVDIDQVGAPPPGPT
jgi:tRNA G26 N,N-dimethylase Trm1